MIGYIDPGTGSLLAQILVSGVFGAVVAFRKAILKFFTKKQHQQITENRSKNNNVPRIK